MTTSDAAGFISAPAGSQRIEPQGLVASTRVAIVAAEYHTDIVQPLVDGAVAECIERGVAPDSISIIPIPGAFEVGLAAQHCAQNGYDAVIALACVIRGDTPHFEYVCGEAARDEGHRDGDDEVLHACDDVHVAGERASGGVGQEV